MGGAGVGWVVAKVKYRNIKGQYSNTRPRQMCTDGKPYQVNTTKSEASFSDISPVIDLHDWQKALWKSRPVKMEAMDMRYLV